MAKIRVDIRRDGAISNRAVITVLAVLPEGTRNVPGLWFRAQVPSDLRNRSAQDILIAVMDAPGGVFIHGLPWARVP